MAGVLLECAPCFDCLSAGDFALDLRSAISLSWSSARSDLDLPRTGIRFLLALAFTLLVEVRVGAEVEGATGAGLAAAGEKGR